MHLPSNSALRIAFGIFVLVVIPVFLMLPNGVYWSDNGDLFRVNARRGGLGILYVHSADRYWELNPKAKETNP